MGVGGGIASPAGAQWPFMVSCALPVSKIAGSLAPSTSMCATSPRSRRYRAWSTIRKRPGTSKVSSATTAPPGATVTVWTSVVTGLVSEPQL